ncbi:GspE/PulE family protein [Arhodomonas sp. AD133]|uniref:GspE/PulE family protein n=1 Tax=Arhodomonas sp. AD133 TaxID=3415009 RepID=UPI003EBC9675
MLEFTNPRRQPDADAGSTPGAGDTPMRVGERLLHKGVIGPAELDYVLQKQAVEGGRLGNLLVNHGLATQKDVALALAEQHGEAVTFVSLDTLPEPDIEATRPFNQALCLAQGFLPLRLDDDTLTVVLGDSAPDAVAEVVRRRTGWRVRCLQGEFTRVTQAIRQHYYFAEHPPEAVIQRELRLLEQDVDRVHSPERLLEHILNLAVRERATDIHLAPTRDSRHVLFRIDGVLRPMFALSPALDRLNGFIKLYAEMDVAEQRLPQDGSFNREVLDQPFTVRVSSLIAEHGERMVLRLLPERSDLDKLEDLGFHGDDVATFARLFARPHGLVLLTGPTGSGKSTTLHAALRMQALIERNVLTVEDPVEYRVPAVGQTEVNERAGYGFSNALRYFLRHDPDVILVGEIRDAETARAALDAASTGHLVLSTLHVGSIFGVVPRLKLLGLDVETVAENLIGVVNQRLVRRVCPHCRTAVTPAPAEREWLRLAPGEPVYEGAGCRHCRGSGFLGRLPVYELLLPDRAVADAIAVDCPRGELRHIAEASGMRSIHAVARQRVRAGETTVGEVHRAVGAP